MDFEKLANINLIKGAGGGDPRKGLCIMEMVSYFDGADRVTDSPECACPVLTRFAIRLNDNAPTQEDRDSLKPLLPLLTGSRDDAAKTARVRLIVFETARRLVAPLYDKRWPKHAAAIREAKTYEELRAACLAAKKTDAAYAYAAADAAYAYAAADAAYAYAAADAAYAYAAADAADAYAADAADAADAAYAYAAAYAAAAYAAAAAADAYAAAAYAAAAAADAYAAAAYADDAKSKAWHVSKEILIEAIKLGAHGSLDFDAPETVARAEKLLALLGA